MGHWSLASNPASPPNPMLESISRITGVTKDNWVQALSITAIWFAWFLGGFILFAWAVFYYTKDWPSGVAVDWMRNWLSPFWEIYNFW